MSNKDTSPVSAHICPFHPFTSALAYGVRRGCNEALHAYTHALHCIYFWLFVHQIPLLFYIRSSRPMKQLRLSTFCKEKVKHNYTTPPSPHYSHARVCLLPSRLFKYVFCGSPFAKSTAPQRAKHQRRNQGNQNFDGGGLLQEKLSTVNRPRS
jgi:hypothetical protein